MDLAVAPVLENHPTALFVGQMITAGVAVISFYLAYRVTRPATSRPAKEKRQDKTESQLGLLALCNPGRRASDRCSVCPMDEHCLRNLPPRTEAEQARDDAATVAVNARSSTVVFVDDNDALRQVVEVLLRDAGVRVRLARSASSAVPFSDDERVLVTDWRLDDGTGAEVIRAFRDSDPGRPVIIVSALEQPPKEAPRNIHWVSKPFDPDQLVLEISRLLAVA